MLIVYPTKTAPTPITVKNINRDMSKMKSMLAMSLMISAITMANHDNSPRIRDKYIPKETDEEKQKRLLEQENKLSELKGLQKFSYMQGSLYALNQKSANKKAKKRGWI